MTEKRFSKTKKNLARPPDLQQGLYCAVGTFCNAYSFIIPFHIHKALTSMNCFHCQSTIHFLRSSMQKILSHNYPLISLTALFPNSCSIPFNEIWLMFIAHTQTNTKSSSLVQLHPFKDLVFFSKINNKTLNPKDLKFKIVLQDLKGRIFHQSSFTEVAVFRH